VIGKNTFIAVLTENVIGTEPTAKETTCLAITERHSTSAATDGSLSINSQGLQNEVPQRVLWEFWRITQSEYRYRQPGVVDLGEIL